MQPHLLLLLLLLSTSSPVNVQAVQCSRQCQALLLLL
jgi:hypothetical protein